MLVLIRKYYWSLCSPPRVSLQDIVVLFQQFSALLNAGVALITCLELLSGSTEKVLLRALVLRIKHEALAGRSLHESFKHYPQHFDELTCHLIKIGEQTGKLDKMLLTIVIHLEKKRAFRRQIQQAIFYPCIILLAALLITLSMFIFVVPKFADLFNETKVPLPLLTTFIFTCAAWIKEIVICLLLCLAILSVLFLKKRNAVIAHLKSWCITLPFIKSNWQHLLFTRFAQQLAITLRAGIPLADALKIITQNNNAEFITQLTFLKRKINSGLQLHQAMASSQFFPYLMVQMIKIGEESGMLEAMLEKVAEWFESETKERLAKCNTLLEPMIMLILGVLVGGLVIGMYLPIFKLGNTL